jgi:hypothetical protein
VYDKAFVSIKDETIITLTGLSSGASTIEFNDDKYILTHDNVKQVIQADKIQILTYSEPVQKPLEQKLKKKKQ